MALDAENMFYITKHNSFFSFHDLRSFSRAKIIVWSIEMHFFLALFASELALAAIFVSQILAEELPFLFSSHICVAVPAEPRPCVLV